jgi:hypothetical protein
MMIEFFPADIPYALEGVFFPKIWGGDIFSLTL